jgi:hypothetical protein
VFEAHLQRCAESGVDPELVALHPASCQTTPPFLTPRTWTIWTPSYAPFCSPQQVILDGEWALEAGGCAHRAVPTCSRLHPPCLHAPPRRATLSYECPLVEERGYVALATGGSRVSGATSHRRRMSLSVTRSPACVMIQPLVACLMSGGFVRRSFGAHGMPRRF